MTFLKPFLCYSTFFLFVSTAFAQDWANLNRYKAANMQLENPDAKEKRVVFMGNSITEGWSKISPEFFKGKAYINRGISGQTTPQMLLRFRQDVIDLKPSIIVILAGINDIAQNTGPTTIEMIEDNIISMAELAKENGIDVILCSVLPANKFPWRPEILPADKVIQLNGLIKAYADKNGHTYLDYYSAMVDNEKGLRAELGSDGVHPIKSGYVIMEGLVQKAIEKSMNRFTNLPDPLAAGWKGHKVCEVLAEDETQRILKCTFPPNIGHEKHYHARHFGYTIAGGTFRITDATGTKEINVPTGATWSKDSLSSHEVLNIGNSTSIYLIVEPK